jgi:hypothetical protein
MTDNIDGNTVGQSGLTFDELKFARQSVLGWKDRNHPVVRKECGGDFQEAFEKGVKILHDDPSFKAAFRSK